MKNLDCIQIEIFINLEIIEEEDKNNIYIYIYLKIQQNIFNLVKPHGAINAFKPTFII